jgi:hypothetical protein
VSKRKKKYQFQTPILQSLTIVDWRCTVRRSNRKLDPRPVFIIHTGSLLQTTLCFRERLILFHQELERDTMGAVGFFLIMENVNEEIVISGSGFFFGDLL